MLWDEQSFHFSFISVISISSQKGCVSERIAGRMHAKRDCEGGERRTIDETQTGRRHAADSLWMWNQRRTKGTGAKYVGWMTEQKANGKNGNGGAKGDEEVDEEQIRSANQSIGGKAGHGKWKEDNTRKRKFSDSGRLTEKVTKKQKESTPHQESITSTGNVCETLCSIVFLSFSPDEYSQRRLWQIELQAAATHRRVGSASRTQPATHYWAITLENGLELCVSSLLFVFIYTSAESEQPGKIEMFRWLRRRFE